MDIARARATYGELSGRPKSWTIATGSMRTVAKRLGQGMWVTSLSECMSSNHSELRSILKQTRTRDGGQSWDGRRTSDGHSNRGFEGLRDLGGSGPRAPGTLRLGG